MKKRLFSGIQPSGNLHIGNYLGAIKQWLELQNDHEAIFCIVDLHAITVPQDPEELRKKTLEIAKIYLAAGIDPEKSTLFVQSQVKEHAELGWILNTIARMGELGRMPQYKDKSRKNIIKFKDKDGEAMERRHMIEEEKSIYVLDKIGVGLFTYPVLMAADILLYDTAVVPAGRDQEPHIELARDLAERFNKNFGETFVIPEGKLSKEGQLIMGLDDPTKKMSKSASSEYNYIALSDDAETVRKKIKKAVTDSGSEIVYQDDKPALKNLINIYSLLSGKSSTDIETDYKGRGYADFKNGLAKVIVGFLEPFQKKVSELDDDRVLTILNQGALKARGVAEAKMKEVRQKVGFLG